MLIHFYLLAASTGFIWSAGPEVLLLKIYKGLKIFFFALLSFLKLFNASSFISIYISQPNFQMGLPQNIMIYQNHIDS